MRAKHNPEMVTLIKESLTGVETGTATEVENGAAFKKSLALTDGLTSEVVEQVSNHVTTFVASGQEAIGDLCLAAMKKDKKLGSVNAEVSMGAFGKVGYTVHREKEITIPPREAGGEATRRMQFGSTKVDVTFVAGKDSGLLGQARSKIKADYAEQFGKK